jgi:tRNA modification GTPase
VAHSRSTSQALLLTPPGAAAIAVVRLVGPAVGAFLRAHLEKPLAPGRCIHGLLRDGERVIDDPVVVLAPNEGSADVNLHGGPWVVRSVLELARREGFEVRERPDLPLPPEAVDGRTELEQEVLAHLPMARTELALRGLLVQEQAWELFLKSPQAEQRAEAQAMLLDCGLWWLLHPPRVAIAGAPNVGKSTLANQLFAQERSITADVPGTTRDWVGEVANIDGLAVVLVDTPGIRQTSDPIEAAAIERSGGELRTADLVLLVLDGSRPLGLEQAELLRQFPSAIRVINKCDLPAAWNQREIDGVQIVATSGAGVNALRESIKRHFGVAARGGAARWWTERQRQTLETLVQHV